MRSDMGKSKTPLPIRREKREYKSVLHRECGGEIVVVSDGKDWKMACKRCLEAWDVELPNLPFPTKSQLADDMEVMTTHREKENV